jgi:hypothetical protein
MEKLETTSTLSSVVQVTKKESSSGECNSARNCEVHDIHVDKTSTITVETKTLWALKAS